jgi:hypothetical protein
MSLCCTEIQGLGCFTNCEVIKTGLTAAIAGDYIIREYWLDGVNDQTVTLAMTDPIDFPNIYNECAEHTIKIFDPNGDVVVNGSFDCFSFQVNAVAT